MLALYLSMCSSEEEEDVLNYIYNDCYLAMYCASYRVVEDPELSRDLVHDTMLKLVMRVDKLCAIEHDKLKAYVAVASYNMAVDYVRANGNRRTVNLENEFSEFDIEDRSVSVIDTVIDNDEYNRIVRCIRSLPETYRDVCYLRFVCNIDEKEIAKELNITYENVAIRIHRGRKLLQKKILEVQKSEK